MTYSKVGSIVTLEKDGLRVKIDYDNVISKIDEEINGSYIYETGEDEKNLYYFGKKGITKDDYINSLEAMKILISSMFSDVPTFDVFEYLQLTKKGKFALNRKVNLASPVVGLFYNYDYYKYIEHFSLFTEVIREDLVEVRFLLSQGDVNKFEPIFFEDYTSPIIRVKMSAIKKKDLKPGYIYSDEKQKKYFIYVGKALLIRDNIVKQSKTMLAPVDFTDEEIEEDALNREYKPTVYLSVKLTKKQYDALKAKGETRKVEDYVKDILEGKVNGLYLNWTESPVRVFHEEGMYLEDYDEFKVINRQNCHFIDNTSPCVHYGGLPKDTFTSLFYNYIKMLKD